ncbi:hypothetical protein GF312_04725 [Candidatus Poribacteria bacterium]|nr:hypothetical protein [Candidatus Poribacteria bacterium]
MRVKLVLCMVVVLIAAVDFAEANEPTWLFTVPKAQSLGRENFNLGFLYADIGITDNLELGIHGLKYSVPDSSVGFGFSIWPMGTPYVVFSPGSESTRIHLGIKAAPYIFFAGLESSLSRNIKLGVEFNSGVNFGVRIVPAENWTLDIFAWITSFELYRYNYRLGLEDYRILPGIQFAYNGSL